MTAATLSAPTHVWFSGKDNFAEPELTLLSRTFPVSYMAQANPRFDKHVLIDFLGCHYWSGSKNDGGYGEFHLGGGAVKAHRFAYERTKGIIPGHLQVDHVCVNPPCVNSDHLQLVTQQQNLALARIRAGKASSYGRQDALRDGLAVDLADLLHAPSTASMQRWPARKLPLVRGAWDQLDEGWIDPRSHLS